MTMMASWVACDTHGIASAYIASDSRITWAPSIHYDYAKKVFASSHYPEIFGYAGDVLFPSIVLSQILELIDGEILLAKNMTCRDKNKLVFEKICESLSKYPDIMGDNPVQIMHISRETEFTGYPSFHQYILKWSRNRGFKQSESTLPETSSLTYVLGTGQSEFYSNYERYQKGPNPNTSRNIFHCFIDTLNNVKDYACGGPPQLVGLYRKPGTAGNNYGIIYNKKRYFLGMEVPREVCCENNNHVEWRNENFELCSGETRKILPDAASQPDSLRRR